MRRPAFSEDWPADVAAIYHHDVREIWDRSIAPQVWNQYHDQLARYLRLAGDAPLDILDVGCAQGTLALLLAERGHRVTAVDLRPQFLDYAKSRHTHGDVRFVAANVLQDPIPGEYDLVFANQIVEHLVYPQQLVLRLKDLLRPGGRLVMTTPNHAYLVLRLPSFTALGDPAKWEHLQFTADGDGHFFAYTAAELEAICRRCDFADVRASHFESPFISGHLKVRHVHRWMPVAVLRALDRLLLALPGIGRRFAHQLMVVATKGA